MTIFSNIIHLLHQVPFIAIGVIGIGFLIGFHELGHLLFCKLFGIKAPTFSIGMGPRLITKKLGGTEFSLSAIPLGGYVEIAEIDKSTHPSHSQFYFANRPYWQKLCVMAGGILFNLIFAFLALSFLYYTGMPKTSLLYPSDASTVINAVEQDSPAQKAGLETGDSIQEINNTPMHNASDIISYIQKNPNVTTTIRILRHNEVKEIPLIIGEKPFTTSVEKITHQEILGFLGVDFVTPQFSLIDSLNKGLKATYQLTLQVINAFKGLFFKRQFNNLGGPLAVIAQTVKGAHHGFKIFLLLLTFISINLAVLNVIPLPIMDGGQVLYYTIEAIIGRPLPNRVREYIHYVTWVLVLLLVIYLSIKDIIGLVWA